MSARRGKAGGAAPPPAPGPASGGEPGALPTAAARRRSLAIAIACAAGAIAVVTLAASFGERSTPAGGVATVLHLLVVAGGPAAAYLAGAIGIGALAAPLVRGARDPLALQAGAGLAIMLSLSHGLGALGLFGGDVGRWIALGAVGAGLLLLARQMLVSGRAGDRVIAVPLTPFAALPAVAVMLVAACNPTGWLWPGEGNGYDALSYHLQLPQEWLGAGRIASLEHNVYSYLPSYVEAAFLHIAVMMGAPIAPGPAGGAWGLLAGEGQGVIATQFLSAFTALVAAWLAARLTLRLLTGAPIRLAQACAGLAAAVTLATPWIVVTGALPYTEPATIALGAAAALAAVEVDLAPWRRGLLAGALVGVACGTKMTSIVLVTPVIAALLLGMAPWRQWAPLALPGAAAGLFVIAPWMARNWSAGGNPVFPQATSIFGQAHWTDEQVERYRSAHTFDGGLGARARMLVAPDPSVPAPGPDASAGQRAMHALEARRGLTHPHWAATPAIVGIFGLLALTARPWRRAAALLWLGMLGQILAWTFFTHLQSRFLTPLLIPGAALLGLGAAAGSVGVGAAREGAPALRRWIVPAGCAAALLLQSAVIMLRYRTQREGEPNAWLALGPSAFSGTTPELAQMADESPQGFVARALAPSARIYLLGDSAPFYFVRDAIYTTTWDESLLARAIRAAPDDPAAWRRAIRAAGADWVILNQRELARLRDSGFLDPALTEDNIARLLGDGARLHRSWPESGQHIFRLLAPAGQQSPP